MRKIVIDKKLSEKLQRRLKRKRKIRSRIRGTLQVPRLSVFRSNCNLTVQAIDDVAGKTLVAISTYEKDFKTLNSNIESAQKLGVEFSKRLKEKKITSAVFDRNGYHYHGVIKALADGIRSEIQL